MATLKKGEKKVAEQATPAAAEGQQVVQVITGNTSFLTVKLLGDILAELKKMNAKLEE